MGILWHKSGSIERDDNDARAEGALAYFYEGNTTTPWAVYSDASESTVRTQPVEADANGRWPTVFIPFRASYDVKVTTAGGTQLYYPRGIPNADPVAASEDSVDDTQLLQTGDIIFRHLGGTRTGFVRCNGRTIGSATSGATERANADTEDLYTYLWNGFANSILAVSTGRGASAAADFAANKTILLFDHRSGGFIGVDDMGNSAAGRASLITYAAGNSTTAGSPCGDNGHTLTEAQLPNHTHTFSATSGTESADHTHSISITSAGQSASHTHSGTSGTESADHTHTTVVQSVGVQSGSGTNVLTSGAGVGLVSGGKSATHTHDLTTGTESASHTHLVSGTSGGKSATHTHSVSGTTGTGSGSGTAHNNVPYATSGTFYIKL